MNVSFELIGHDRSVWSEADLAGKGASLAENLRVLAPLYGRLNFESEQFGDEMSITDDIDALITQLCLNSVPAYLAGNTVDYIMAADPGTAQVRFVDDFVTVENEAGENASDPKDGFAQTMVEVGERFLAIKVALEGEEASAAYASDLEQAKAVLLG